MSLFRASGGNKFKIVNGSAKVRVAESKVLYFNGAVDSDWNTLGNWWLDSSFTVPATHLPRSIDSVLVDLGFAGSSLDANGGPTPTVYNLTVGDNQENLPRLSFSININILNIAIFNNNILVPSDINGNVIFNDSTYGNGGTINGNCVFNNSSVNYSNITGNATFNGGSFNYGTVGGDATFNDSSFNSGSVYGDATFNDSSFNDGAGIVIGNATFNNISYNDGVINNATFNDSSANSVNSGANVTGNAIFNNYAINGNLDYSGTIGGNAMFNNGSRNNPTGFVVGTATFNDSSCNNGGTAGTFIPNPPPSCS